MHKFLMKDNHSAEWVEIEASQLPKDIKELILASAIEDIVINFKSGGYVSFKYSQV